MKQDKRFIMNEGNGNRYAVFKGLFNNRPITFRFTYQRNKGQQVIIITNIGNKVVSLDYFNRYVIAARDIRGKFIPA